MGISSFKIYNASAGSGKTYTLTKEYLKLLLSNDSPIKFRQILAITFTNKAVGEMKTRILDNLFLFGNATDAKNQETLFHEICQELSIHPEQLQQRSKVILKRILHNYSFFEVSTIDKFNHKIIKTFARDLQLSQNFEVELDIEMLLEEAVGQLLERAGTDKQLTQVLLDFSLEKIDDDKSWNITYDLVEIGKLLFQENHSSHIEKLRSKSIADFKQIQNNISSEIDAIEAHVCNEAQKVMIALESQGFDASDFPRQTLPNHFKKIMAGDINIKALYGNKLESNLVANNILKSGDTRDSSHLSGYILDRFLYIKKKLFRRNYLKNIYGNIVPLTVLNEIAKEIKNIEIEKDIIPISSLNTLLSKEIKNQPVPFIYERMGEKYRHYFIDEFQDTSQMQWENLIPLIGNALEGENEKNEQGSLFLVGDVKQAIYRWRGGRAEQFLDLLNSKTHPFVVEPSIDSLDTNWRSYSEIITFNNSFFTLTAPFLKNEAYKKLFLEGSDQKQNTKEGGFVTLSFLEKDVYKIEEENYREVLSAIDQITAKNYPYSDICILVRDNKKGMLLANLLSENQIPIISSDSLLLYKNEKVTFLISLLKFIENLNDEEAIFQVLSFLAIRKSKKHHFISSNMSKLKNLLSKDYGFHIEELRAISVLSILETAIVCFNLVNEAEAYLTFLMDEVLLVENREGPGIYPFLKYWEQKKSSLSIAAPDNVNAIKIMTIHKAKGLEFPFVIFPFANGIIDDKRKKKKSWVAPTKAESKWGLGEFLINTKQEMLFYNELTANTYETEEEKTALDAINVLYVALTRAEKGLYIITEKARDQISLAAAQSYSDLFQHYINELGIQKNDLGVYTFGSLVANPGAPKYQNLHDRSIPYITRFPQNSGFTLSTKSSFLWDDEKREAIEMGNLFHFVLSQIKTVADVPKALEHLLSAGHFQKDSKGFIEQKMLDVVNHPQLKEFFSDKFHVLNEKEILTVKAKSLRPDRIIVYKDEATVIDYKTGKPSFSHKSQIMEYAEALKAMGFTVKHTIIVYIDQEINPVFL